VRSQSARSLIPAVEETLEAGSVVWDYVTNADPAALVNRAKWVELKTKQEPVVVRGIHLATARSRLVALKESLARQHRYVLADIPVFAPLSATKLLALCRRAKLVDVRPGSIVLAADEMALNGGTIPLEISQNVNQQTFGLVLSGELQVYFSHGQTATSLPNHVPLARLGKRDTFGEVGALAGTPLPPGVSLRSESGATLLTWERDKFLLDEISMMVGDSKDHTTRPSLLECSWRGRTPLSLLTVEPDLLKLLKPTTLEEITEKAKKGCILDGSAEHELSTSMLHVLSGEMKRQGDDTALVDVHLLEDNTLPPGRLKVGIRRRVRLSINDLIGMRAQLMEAGHQVSDGNFSVEGGDRDAFEVFLSEKDTRPTAVRIAELTEKVHAMQTTEIRTGMTIPCITEDGVVPKLAAIPGQPAPMLAIVDLRELGTELAQDDKKELSLLWRKFVHTNARGLLPPSLAPPDNATKMRKEPNVSKREKSYGEDVDLADPTQVEEWLDALCSFNLFRVRQFAGQHEVGVTPAHLELGLKLGEGGYGVVHMARHRVSGELYAVKSFTKSKIRRIEERETYMRLERERKILKLLATELRGLPTPLALARLICSGQDKEMLRLVMPACLGGDLQDLMEAQGRLSDEHVQFYAACTINALSFLHDLQIAYRDLKPENVLLDATGWPVLTDFGLVSLSLEDGPATSMVGTPEFMAPEVIEGTGHDTMVDMWSLGVMMCELLTGSTPFSDPEGNGQNHQKTYTNIVQGKFTKTFMQKEYKRLPKRTTEVIGGLLQVDPEKRLGLAGSKGDTLRVHPFFWGLSWDALESRQIVPPHKAFTGERAAGMLTKVHAAPHTPLPRSVAPSFHRRAASATTINGDGNHHDAAASAMDKMFDFSEW